MTATLSLASTVRAAPSALAFDALYRECRDDLYAYVATVLGDRAAAEDACAQAFERAYRRRARYDPRRGSPRAWLFAIARNAALDELRRRRRTAALLVDAADVESPDPDDGAEHALRRRSVRDGLASLMPRERELIALKFFAGLTNGEIATLVAVSETNAGTALHRAVTKLRRACDVAA